MMGGSGGFGYSPRRIDEIRREIEKEGERREFDDAIEAAIESLLSAGNQRDAEGIQTHIDVLLKAISNEIESSIAANFGGSVGKHTYVDGISDVDLLLDIKDSDLALLKPKEAISKIAGMLKSRLPNTEIETGAMSIKIRYSDGCELQMLPAVKTKTGYKIADPKSDMWSPVVRPDIFAKKLTQVNRDNKGMVVPLIKVMKGIQEKFPEKYRLTGYHLESLALEAFEMYKGDYTKKNMITAFCQYVIDGVKTPIKDKTGQSLHVDDYLGKSSSSARMAVSEHYVRIANRLKASNTQLDIDTWMELLND